MVYKNDLGDGPLEEKYREKMLLIGRGLDEIFNGETKGQDRQTGFILLVFPFGNDDGRCNYLSNGADRRDVILLLEEQLKRFKAMHDNE
jgi:hypothetical protein